MKRFVLIIGLVFVLGLGITSLAAEVWISTNAVPLKSGVPQTISCEERDPDLPGGVLCPTQFYIDVPSNAASLIVEVVDSGEFTLYARFGEEIEIREGSIERDYEAESRDGKASITIDASSHPPLRAGTYYIAVVNFHAALQKFTITATIPPRLKAEFTAEPTSGCAPLSVQFTDQSEGDISSFLWGFGDESTSMEQNPEHIYQDPGEFTVSLTVEGPDGEDTETKENFITVLPCEPQLSTIPDSLDHDFGDIEEGETSFWTFTVENSGSGTLEWSAESDQPWISLDPLQGELGAGEEQSVTIRIDTSGLTAGENIGNITIDSNGGRKRGNIKVNVIEPPLPEVISLTPLEPQIGTVKANALSSQYAIEVGEGVEKLSIDLRNQGNGDINLHVRFKQGVEKSDDEIIADFSSVSPTGIESIVISGSKLRAGIYYAAVENLENSSQTFVIKAATTPAFFIPLVSGKPVSGEVRGAGPSDQVLSLTQYTIQVIAGAKKLSIALENLGVGDINLHMRYGSPIQIRDGEVIADYSSISPIGIESMVISGSHLQAGVYYIAIENQEDLPQQFIITATVN